MKIFQSISEFSSTSKTIVTLGTFDGVHIGHKKIIEKLLYNATLLNCKSLILTFFPHPRMVLQSNTDLKLLNTINEKISLLDRAGIDYLIVHPFDKDFSRLTSEDFVKTILVQQFNVQKIIIGYDHRFGRNRTADINDLIDFGTKYGFEVQQISAQEINEVAVSSTKIRNALNQGNIELANKYLGYPYTISGKVIKGKQIGRTIGFPTANIEVDQDYKLIPQNGVYIVESFLNNKKVFGMMNIGFNPTVNGVSQKIEIHLLDFNNNLYDTIISFSIIKRIRSEQKFASLEELKNQIQNDKKFTQNFVTKV